MSNSKIITVGIGCQRCKGVFQSLDSLGLRESVSALAARNTLNFAMHNATQHLNVSHDKISGLLIVIIRQGFNA
jgi:hypothetical protein